MTRVHHHITGPGSAPALILGPSLGTSLAVWDPQVAALAATHRVVRWDLPGHGGSPADLISAKATVADLGRLVLDLADELGVERFAYAGISLGGAVGVWLAAHQPQRLEKLAVVCSSAHFGDPRDWHDRAALVRANRSTGPIADSAGTRWFTPAFQNHPIAKALADDLRAADPDAYAACCDALASYDARPDLSRITAATLVVAGRNDPATPVAHARELADGISDACLTEVAHAAHLANVEQPQAVLAALTGHFAADLPERAGGGDSHAGPPFSLSARAGADDAARHAAGMTVRRAVLGDAHVDRAIAQTTPFTAVFQDFITRYAWGEVWTRPGLSRKTRSCITLTALVAHGHHEELAMHVRAALRNGLTPAEIREVLLQSAIYCGVPAANAAFAIANRTITEEAIVDDEDSGQPR
ncbi:4-carboxymuconolactone decarboxylase [Micromonospora sp. KC213]|uniref:bifunctional 3-oxoadipate enol-lactonase/4-carboxymuconolactone decarboxylase PcaDC n=1 Tax=Micromonospora sp. KC213 TaxID=2530378 RepID=UPI0010446F67|nr:4-carboxymuconolactone decarboxylase [Micromonospora sp. KC213]TDC40293.1 4-carboxymuconolactone decarboxylase [Micromonospora sp. KC213]